MSVRRPTPIHLLLVLLAACLAPVGVVVATGLADTAVDDTVETADDGDHDGEDDGDGDGAADGRGDDIVRLDDGVDGDRDGSLGRRWGSATPTSSTTTSTSATVPPTTATTAPPTTAPPTTAPAPPPPPPPSATDQVVMLVNQARASAGCGPLSVNAALTAAAQAHSDDMAANGYFSHTSLDGRTFDQRIRDAGYSGGRLGENIAQGQDTAQAVHDAWMNSPDHRRNILDCRFADIGVGLNTASWTWTQDFGG